MTSARSLTVRQHQLAQKITKKVACNSEAGEKPQRFSVMNCTANILRLFLVDK